MAEETGVVTENQDASASNGAHGEGGRNARKVREGIVVSDKMDKTVVVAVERLKRHPLYGRVQRVTKKFKAHDETNECKTGDRVRIMETRPLSRDKRWRILQIMERAK
jgi:small subunit ribosomal protein S17